MMEPFSAVVLVDLHHRREEARGRSINDHAGCIHYPVLLYVLQFPSQKMKLYVRIFVSPETVF